MIIAAIVFQILLALAFLFSGGSKLIGAKSSLVRRDHLHVAPWFWLVTGVIEALVAFGLLVGLWLGPLAFLAALALAATMIGAVFTQLRNKQSLQDAVPALALLVMALLVALVRWLDVTHLLG